MMNLHLINIAAVLVLWIGAFATSDPPRAGEKAPNFSLAALDSTVFEFNTLLREGPVVLIVLRGFPGYQCPICNRQVRAYVSTAAQFSRLGARVVFVYPGPSSSLEDRGAEFISDKDLPVSFVFLLDPDYSFTNLYHLRWDEKRETAYPSTFVVDTSGTIRFAVVSNSHGGRVSPQTALEEVIKLLPSDHRGLKDRTD